MIFDSEMLRGGRRNRRSVIGGAGLSPDTVTTRRNPGGFLPAPGARAGRSYLRTGDLARRGADGLFYFVGRAIPDQEPRLPHRARRNRDGPACAARTARCAWSPFQSAASKGDDLLPMSGARLRRPPSSRPDCGRAGARAARYMLRPRWMRCDTYEKRQWQGGPSAGCAGDSSKPRRRPAQALRAALPARVAS